MLSKFADLFSLLVMWLSFVGAFDGWVLVYVGFALRIGCC